MLLTDNSDIEDRVAVAATVKEVHTAGKILTETVASTKVKY